MRAVERWNRMRLSWLKIKLENDCANYRGKFEFVVGVGSVWNTTVLVGGRHRAAAFLTEGIDENSQL
jgi:hypothetical protein